ncbi:MAG TPA: hypothetical protein VK642_14860 [Burkholderiales bacterium]|nr:hypothetical protein [Burkholderiales bacterium]
MSQISARQKSYFYAIGRFIHFFSRVESALHVSFAEFASIPDPVARAIKRGSKSGELIAMIKGVIVATKMNEKDTKEIKTVFDQFEAIAQFRDRVIHRGASVKTDGTFFSSNLATMKTPELWEFTTFTVQDIRNATDDLIRINLRILRIAFDLPMRAMKSRARGLFLPWRYKPVKLQTPRSQTLPYLLSPAIRPRSSRR